MRKIAILAPYVGSVNRGAETFVIELTKKISTIFDVEVFTIKTDQVIEKYIQTVEVNTGLLYNLHSKAYTRSNIYRKVINKFYFLIPDVIFQKKFTKRVFQKIENKKYDLIFPNNGIWGAKYASKYREKNETPFVYTGHGGIGLGEKYIIETKPDAYICLTQKHLLWADKIKKDNEVKTLVIPNGVCVDDFERNKKENLKTTIISVAALTEFKRHELTIEAVSKIPDVMLIILGKGEEEKKLKDLANKLLPDRCIITSTSYENIKKYYADSNLFVLPSREEPFGIVYLEAMASNLPIVAPDDSQRREIIANAGLYCNVENTNEYAETIKKALHIDWGEKPLERARLYDWNNIADKYIGLFNQIIDGE